MKRDFKAIEAVDGVDVAVEFARVAFHTRGLFPNKYVLEQVRQRLEIEGRQDVELGPDVGDEDRVCPDIDVTRRFVINVGHCHGLEVSANILKVALTYDQEFSSVVDIWKAAIKISPRRKARLEEGHRANNTRTNSFVEMPARDRS